MAEFGFNHWGGVLTLEHEEVATALNAVKAGAGLTPEILAAIAAAGVVTAGVATAIGAAVVAYFAAEGTLITDADKGCGIYLTLPYPAFYLGQWWAIIPGSRKCGGAIQWDGRESGQLSDEDGDIINFTLEGGLGDSNAVEFVLNSSGPKWRKEIIIDDGMSGRWTIFTDGQNMESRNGLYTNQLPLGKLIFRKAKDWGIMWDVMELPINFLSGDSRATFYWVQD
jgi:hypothetical protein